MSPHYTPEELLEQFPRFWSKVDFNGENGCWLWKRYIDSHPRAGGYGRFVLNRKQIGAHRVAYTLLKGEIPEGKEIDHLCRVKKCVNPDHLEAVTHAENLRRYARLTTHCPRGHEYDEENTVWRKGTEKRDCYACSKERKIKRYQEKKAKLNPFGVQSP